MKLKFILFLFFTHSLFACNTDTSKHEVSIKTFAAEPKTMHNAHISKPNDTLQDICNFIGGKQTTHFAKQQNNPNYKSYQEYIVSKKNESSTQTKIKTWQEKNITQKELSLFYPFSGPDFLYAYSFFPKADNYILLGLEKLGTIPQIKKLSPTQISQYSKNLKHALRYIDKVGYFTTNQMRNDFEKPILDGVIHIIMHYISNQNLSITSFKYIELDKFGNQKEIKAEKHEKSSIQALKIGIQNPTHSKPQYIYYFQLDVTNENMLEYPEFLFFLNKFGKKNTYMKAASYIFHDSRFSILRNICLNQSQLILQDDTGIPYTLLQKANFNSTFFGKYTKTIPEFEHFFQTNLAKDVQTTSKPIDFQIGYNSWHNEMLLMLNTKNPNAKTQHNKPEQSDKIKYKVQIKASTSKLPLSSTIFKGLDVDFYFEAPWYKYTIGNETTKTACAPHLKLAKSKGFHDAFIVGIKNGKRIYMEE